MIYNQNPEQLVRYKIDKMLIASGWLVQSKKQIYLSAAKGIAIREYQTDVGPADYILFINKKPVGLIEAKREEEGVRLTMHQDQAEGYAKAKLRLLNNEPLSFIYESTGELTRFTDYRDPKPRSRPVFTFHRPETFELWLREPKTLRAGVFDIPSLSDGNSSSFGGGREGAGLRDCQVTAITNLEKLFRENRPKALVQMATGSGKTFTAIKSIYRLLKFARAKRILFLVNTRNLGEQAEQEFKRFQPQDDNRLFPELYGVTRLSSSFIPHDSQVYISTIQRLYSILKGTELDERDEEEYPASKKWKHKEPMPVVYNERTPMEFFPEKEDPKTVLQQFRMSYYPRIAVTVDMIATGTDIRPLEVLLFMRDVKSRSYYEQMKGRGTRTCSLEELRTSGTPAAKFTKDHFVIIDAIGVEKSQKTDSRPLEKKPGLSLKGVLEHIAMGNKDEDLLTTLANRLIRLDKQINDKEKAAFAEKAGGKTINQVVKQLLNAYDPDTIENVKCKIENENPGASPGHILSTINQQLSTLVDDATAIFNDYELRNYIIDVRKKYDQFIDHINPDEIVNIGWVKDNKAAAESIIHDFKTWIEAHKTEITALQVFYAQPYQRRELSYAMIRDLAEAIKTSKPTLAPLHVWRAYEQIEKVNGHPKNELIALVSLVRTISGADTILTSFDKTVDKNFQDWIFKKQAGLTKYTTEQVQWLRMIKDYIANSFHVDRDDFELDPFNKQGGLGKMWQLFGEETDAIINELNESLVA